MTSSTPLVIGIGNRDRGDDAVGPMVADAVCSRYGTATEHIVMEGDVSDLAVAWRPGQAVVIIDAMQSGRPPGAIVEIDALATPGICTPALSRPPLSTHGFGVAEAIELARVLDRLPRSLTVIAVEAKTFDLFAPVTEAVAAAADVVAIRIARLLRLEQPGLSTNEHN